MNIINSYRAPSRKLQSQPGVCPSFKSLLAGFALILTAQMALADGPIGLPSEVATGTTSISGSSAGLGATVNPNGATTSCWFFYNPQLSATGAPIGLSLQSAPITVSGTLTGAVPVSGTVTGLAGHTWYSYFVSGSNVQGVTYSASPNPVFATSDNPPVVSSSTINATWSITSSGTVATVNLAPYVSDPDGDALFVSAVGSAGAGTTGTASPLVVTYTPGTGFTGTDSFPFSVSDIVPTGFVGGTTSGIVKIGSELAAPQVAITSATATGTTSEIINAIATGSATTLKFNVCLLSASGTVVNTQTLVQSGTYSSTAVSGTFTGLNGHANYSYFVTASNSFGVATSATGTFTTSDRPPVAPTVAAVWTGYTAVVNLSSTVSDPDGDSLTLVAPLGTGSEGGTTSITGPLAITYKPGSAFTGSDNFTYSISDGHLGGTTTGTVTVVAYAPTVTAKTASSITGTSAVMNATVVSGGPITTVDFNLVMGSGSTAVTLPQVSQILVTGSANPMSAAAPVALKGHSTYYYTVTGSNILGLTTSATTSFTTLDNAPTIIGAGPIIVPMSAVTSATTINLAPYLNDIDGDSLAVSITGTASEGTAVVLTGSAYASASGTTSVTYTPGAAFTGSDSFVFTVTDSYGLSAPTSGTVVIVMMGVKPVVTVVNATSINGGSAILHGLVNSNRSVTSAQFFYTASGVGVLSSSGTTVSSGIAAATLDQPIAGLIGHSTYYFWLTGSNPGSPTVSSGTLTFNTPDNPPVIANPIVSGSWVGWSGAQAVANLTANVSDADYDQLTLTATNTAHGQVTVTGSSMRTVLVSGSQVTIGALTLSYKPLASFSGSDTIPYTVSDGYGGSASGVVTISATAPALSNLGVASVTGSSAVAGGRITPNGFDTTVLLKLWQPGTTGTTTYQLPTVSGSLAFKTGTQALSGLISYTAYSFTLTASNVAGSVTSAPSNFTTLATPPTAPNVTLFLTGTAGSTSVDLRKVVGETDGDPVIIISVANNQQFGTVTNVNGLVTYTANPLTFTGADSFNYTATDSAGRTATAFVTVRLIGSNNLTKPVDVNQGSQVPGLASGWTFGALGIPSIADSGNFANTAVLETPGGKSLAALYSGTNLLAYQTGTVAIPTVSGTFVASFNSFADPLVDDQGHVAFIAKLGGIGVLPGASDTAIFSNAPDGVLRMVKRSGDLLLGALPIASFQGLALQPVLDGSTPISVQVLYTATLVKGGVITALNDHVIACQTIGPLGAQTDALVAISGVSTVNGHIIKSFDPFKNAASVTGQTRAFVVPGEITFPVVLGTGTQAIVNASIVGSTVSLTGVAFTGTSTSALLQSQTLPGATWASLGSPITDFTGERIALVGVAGVPKTVDVLIKGKKTPKVVVTDTTGIFTSFNGGASFEPYVLVGGTAPGANKLTYQSFRDPVMDEDSGGIAFLATLKGAPAASATGIWWSGTSGTLALLARTGSVVPVASGANVITMNFSAFNSLSLPTGGSGPLFVGTIANAPAAYNSVLCVVDMEGVLVKLVQTGDQFPVNISGNPLQTLKTLKSFSVIGTGSAPSTSGVTRSFNGTGVIIYGATFTDNTQAILRAYIP